MASASALVEILQYTEISVHAVVSARSVQSGDDEHFSNGQSVGVHAAKCMLDGDFANALHRLRLKGYNVLLVKPDQPVKSALLGAASSVWYWTSVVTGHTHLHGFSDSAAEQRWVSVNDMKYEFPDDVWMEFGQFLCCEKNREQIMNSNARSEAARVLKHFGPVRIQQLLMRQIVLLLNQSIQKKNWLCIRRNKGWSSVVVNLQAVVAFTSTGEQCAKPTDQLQNAQTIPTMSLKMAEKIGMDIPSTSWGEVKNAKTLQRVKNWLLHLRCSRKGYGLSFIQRGLMEDAKIFLDLKQIEELVSLISDDFRLEKKNGLLLLFRKMQIPDPAVKRRFIETESVECKPSEMRVTQVVSSESVGGDCLPVDSIKYKVSNEGMNSRVSEEAISKPVIRGELGSCEDGQVHNMTSQLQTVWTSEILSIYFVILVTVFLGCWCLCGNQESFLKW
ncbi:hypothetical protein GOP47_0027200 [Adiantum capillus-veneris]|nr:hypothetical protein GOP47_0027200 [Adiantum capillus-veneris]